MATMNIPLRFYDTRDQDIKARNILEIETKDKKITKQQYIIEAIIYYYEHKNGLAGNELSKEDIISLIEEKVKTVIQTNDVTTEPKPKAVFTKPESIEEEVASDKKTEFKSVPEVPDLALDFIKGLM